MLTSDGRKLSKITDGGSKYIVLATDGEPDTCPGTCVGPTCPVPDRPGWPRDPQCGQDRSVAAVQEAFKQGIKGSRLVSIPEAGHMVIAEKTARVVEAIAGFCDRTTDDGRRTTD